MLCTAWWSLNRLVSGRKASFTPRKAQESAVTIDFALICWRGDTWLKTLLKRKRNYLTMLNLNSSIAFLLRSSFSSGLRTLSPQTLMATSRLSVVFRGKVLPEFRSSRQIKINVPSRMKYKFKGLWLLQMRIFVNRLIIYFYSLNTNVTFRSKLCRQVKKKLAIKVVDCCMQGTTILS